MTDRQLKGYSSPHAEAEHIHPLDGEVGEESGGVIGHLLVAEWAVDVGRPAMALLVNGDYLSTACQRWQEGPELIE
jgi:hypothetical protein